MTQQMKDLDVVALLQDMPEEGLVAGQTGTIVLTHGNGEAFEVEFPLSGRKYVVTTVRREHLLKLHNPARAEANA
jgi:hypothetical protein